MNASVSFSKQRTLQRNLQRQVIVASDSLIKTYNDASFVPNLSSQSSSSTQKPIMYKINDTLPYLADFDDRKRVLKIAADDFLNENLHSDDIFIFFIIDATEDDINGIMEKIQDRDENRPECFVIVQNEQELAQIQQHQQYVQERSDSENIASLQSDIDNSISSFEKLAPKTLNDFKNQELIAPNNYFLISKGLPQHIRKFYNDIYQISNCPIVENFFPEDSNVFADHTKDDETIEEVLKKQRSETNEHSYRNLQIEKSTANKYYIIPLCNIQVGETKNVVFLLPWRTLISRLQNQNPLISKILLTTGSGGRNVCSVGISFLQYFTMYQLFFDKEFPNVLNKVLKDIDIDIDINNYFNNISLATKMLECLVPVSSIYNTLVRNNESIDDNIGMFEEIETPLKELKELQEIYNQFDEPSKKLLREKISYAKMLQSIHSDIKKNSQTAVK